MHEVCTVDSALRSSAGALSHIADFANVHPLSTIRSKGICVEHIGVEKVVSERSSNQTAAVVRHFICANSC